MAHLQANSSPVDLSYWVDFWSQQYDIKSDAVIDEISGREPEFLTEDDVRSILIWKLQTEVHYAERLRELDEFVIDQPGIIERKTRLALESSTDHQALEHLRGLPGMKAEGSVAVASAFLMTLNPNRWTVIDRRANRSLASLRNVLEPISVKPGPLMSLFHILSHYYPVPPSYTAVDSDWGIYMAACREIGRFTGKSLRTIDRALYQAKGQMDYEHPRESERPETVSPSENRRPKVGMSGIDIEGLLGRSASQSAGIGNSGQPEGKMNNPHNSWVALLANKYEGQTLRSSQLKSMFVAIGYEKGSSIPGDHDPAEGDETYCSCNHNGMHIFTHPRKGSWKVQEILFWDNGDRATRKGD